MSQTQRKFSRKRNSALSGKSKESFYTQLVSISIFGFVFCFFVLLFFMHDMPDLDRLETKGRRASIVFESYDGKTIATYGDLFRNVVSINNLPKYVANAVIAIEDRRFYKHCGVDFVGILRAMYTNIVNRRIVQGGSTLTQQLAKNLFLSQDRSLKRKIQEFILALWLERKFSKKQILSIYLNRVYFGACAYGIDAAAFRFYGKKAKQLTLYEAAKLAGTLKAPSIYSPFYNSAKSDQRAETVLTCMLEEGYITATEKKDALQQRDKLSKQSVPMDENRYFTDWALEQAQELVSTDTEDLIIRTTLDSKLQKNATYIIRNVLTEHGFKNGVGQIALVALDKTGAVRAMVGGHTYGSSQFNRTLAVRSFGSAFKYFVYLTAFENGADIYDIVSDMPLTINGWSPKNYKYKSVGNISILEAFVKSVNTCAVRTAQKVGMNNIVNMAERLGLKDVSNNLATVLGTSGTTLIDITAAYGTTMNDGIKMTPFGIISIRTPKGKVIYRAHHSHNKRVVSADACEKMKIVMRELMIRGTGKRARLPRIDCYGKTGTSNDSRDASFIGFAYPLVTGIWVGNDDNTPMNQNITGGTIPAITWKQFMMTAFGMRQSVEEIEIKEEDLQKKPKTTAFKKKRHRKLSEILKNKK
ncbi:MAG: PBP1A family penicillin-binding protein [Alphaproteobacteria bacterium]|nr:PBP1A family penicillin-binding protein [Alphaproteobacteria bacterium]